VDRNHRLADSKILIGRVENIFDPRPGSFRDGLYADLIGCIDILGLFRGRSGRSPDTVSLLNFVTGRLANRRSIMQLVLLILIVLGG